MKDHKKKDEKFPGYPHYPASEDITSAEERIDANVENLSHSNSGKLKKNKVETGTPDASPEIVAGTDADVTAEDLQQLGDSDRDLDEGEDETLLPGLIIGPDTSGDDLDVPGSEDDDENEATGNEDEENNYYSRGQS